MGHQAGFSARGVVLVDDALCSSLVQCADRLENFGFSQFRVFSANCSLRFTEIGAGRTTIDTITKACCRVLFVSLDLRLNISQFLPPTYYFIITKDYFTRKTAFVQILMGQFFRLPMNCINFSTKSQSVRHTLSAGCLPWTNH